MIVNCKDIESDILNVVKQYVDLCRNSFVAEVPKLAMLQIGDVAESSNYVNRKEIKCNEVGMRHVTYNIKDCEIHDVLCLVEILNNNPRVNGIMVQQPIPIFNSLQNERLLQAVALEKDVDGFKNENVGRMYNERDNALLPCTAKGVMSIFKHHEIDVKGKKCLVIGRGRTSGRPIAQMLQNKGATVMIANSKTSKDDFYTLTNLADIIISCTGQEHIIRGYWIAEPNIAIINVGMKWKYDEEQQRIRLYGDVDTKTFDAPIWKDTLVTTVSGSTGALTVAHLLANTCIAHYYQDKVNLDSETSKFKRLIQALENYL